MAFFKTKSSSKESKKYGSSWSRWESSFYGGFLSTLFNHPHVKLPKEINISVLPDAKLHKDLFRPDVVKLIGMVIYYYFSLGGRSIRNFKEVVSRSPAELKKTILQADFGYYREHVFELDPVDDLDEIIHHFRILASVNSIHEIFVKVDITLSMLNEIEESNLEIKELLSNYRKSILEGNIYYKFPVNNDDLRRLHSHCSNTPEGNSEFLSRLSDTFGKHNLEQLTEDSITITKGGGYGSMDACDPDLLKKTVFLNPSSCDYGSICYEDLFGEDYEELSRQISSHLVNTLDITFDPTSDVIKSTRQGKIDSNKLVCATAGDLNVYQRQEENQIVRPFKVVMLGDESGSMGTSARIQAFIMEAYYNAFCEIMSQDDIFIYGHSGDDTPEVYVYNEPGVTDFKERIQRMDSKCENYDSPVIEKIHERVRNMTDAPILMLYFSDGAPSGCNYGGDSANRELKRVSEKCKRDEFLVIGVGLAGRDLSKLYHFNTNIADYEIRHEWRGFSKVEQSLLKATSIYNKAIKTVFC